MSEILDVDLLAFEQGRPAQRRAVVDGVRRSLETGFVYTRHDLSEDLLDTAYGMLGEFFEAPLEEKQRCGRARAPTARPATPGLLVETAASSDEPDWKEMLNWATPIPAGHPLKRKFAGAYPDQVLPEDDRARHHQGALRVPRHDRRPAAPLPARDRRGHRLPRDVLRRHGQGRADADPRHPLPTDGRGARRRPATSGPASTATST